VFLAASNKRGIADKQKKINETNNISGRCHEIYIAPPLQETGRASEDPNLLIDDRRKIILPYKQ